MQDVQLTYQPFAGQPSPDTPDAVSAMCEPVRELGVNRGRTVDTSTDAKRAVDVSTDVAELGFYAPAGLDRASSLGSAWSDG
jgi:hypothetical protein